MGTTVVSDDGRFEWDSEKNEANKRKHGISSEEIIDVFDDPYFLVRYDKSHSVEEDRFNGVGCINGLLVLVTTFTERQRTRIISAHATTSFNLFGGKSPAKIVPSKSIEASYSPYFA